MLNPSSDGIGQIDEEGYGQNDKEQSAHEENPSEKVNHRALAPISQIAFPRLFKLVHAVLTRFKKSVEILVSTRAVKEMSTKVTTIRQKTLIAATPDEVYEVFTNSRKHSAFTGSKATCSPKVGGKFTAWDGDIAGRNLELEKGKKIVQEWSTTEWPDGYSPSRLELTLKKVKGGTEIWMIHSNVPAEQADDLAEGWTEFYWRPLKEYFAKRTSK
jgi:activator of HSP90 ATPase